MFGGNYTGGYQPMPERDVFEKWAWIPVKTTSEKWVWNRRYYIISTYCDENGKPPMKGLAWHHTLTENEYLVWQIKNPKKEPKPPTGGSAIKKAVY